MPRFKGLVVEHKEKEAFQEEQEILHQKHDVEDENVVVVEKSNMAKFTVTTLIRLVKLVATILILTLAAIGLTSLIFPESRDALLSIFHLAAEQTSRMIGGV